MNLSYFDYLMKVDEFLKLKVFTLNVFLLKVTFVKKGKKKTVYNPFVGLIS